MNKRIKELAHKAGVYQETDHDGKLFWSMPEDSWEKFAKLIAKECADYVACGEFGDAGLAEELKKHFGVK